MSYFFRYRWVRKNSLFFICLNIKHIHYFCHFAYIKYGKINFTWREFHELLRAWGPVLLIMLSAKQSAWHSVDVQSVFVEQSTKYTERKFIWYYSSDRNRCFYPATSGYAVAQFLNHVSILQIYIQHLRYLISIKYVWQVPLQC